MGEREGRDGTGAAWMGRRRGRAAPLEPSGTTRATARGWFEERGRKNRTEDGGRVDGGRGADAAVGGDAGLLSCCCLEGGIARAGKKRKGGGGGRREKEEDKGTAVSSFFFAQQRGVESFWRARAPSRARRSCALTLSRRWTRPTGNCRPARCERLVGCWGWCWTERLRGGRRGGGGVVEQAKVARGARLSLASAVSSPPRARARAPRRPPTQTIPSPSSCRPPATSSCPWHPCRRGPWHPCQTWLLGVERGGGRGGGKEVRRPLLLFCERERVGSSLRVYVLVCVLWLDGRSCGAGEGACVPPSGEERDKWLSCWPSREASAPRSQAQHSGARRAADVAARATSTAHALPRRLVARTRDKGRAAALAALETGAVDGATRPALLFPPPAVRARGHSPDKKRATAQEGLSVIRMLLPTRKRPFRGRCARPVRCRGGASVFFPAAPGPGSLPRPDARARVVRRARADGMGARR